MSTKNEAENFLKTKGVRRQIGKNEAENILRNKWLVKKRRPGENGRFVLRRKTPPASNLPIL